MARGSRSRKKPSPTPCPSASPPPRVPAWMEPAAPATGDASSWLILDRFVHVSRRRRGVVQGDATCSSLAEDCAGRQVRASLRIADPPAVSRLYLHWPGRPQINRHFSGPAAIAAHRNSILFRMTVPFENSNAWSETFSFPDDYLVYSYCSSSSSSPPPPSLTVLPPCFRRGKTELDKFFQPHRRQQQRIMFDEDMGILCHGDNGDFTVAHLTHRSLHEVELCLLHSNPPPASGTAAMKWSVNKLQIPPDMKINLGTWRTDVVVPIGGRCLCWVDYYQGMLIVDVLAADSKDQQQQQLLHFIRLPTQALKPRRHYIDVGEPDPLRRVCVTDDGTIKLVCILTRLPPSPDFTIITWTLVDINRGNWTKDVDTIMGADKFFDLCNAAQTQSCLPRVRPSFPVVSLVDPDVICFLLKEKDRNLCWMVEVNMRNKVLQSSALYINEEEGGQPSDKHHRNIFDGHSFVPTKFSSFLSKDAITSRKLSEIMQKVKQELLGTQKAEEERAMQKPKK